MKDQSSLGRGKFPELAQQKTVSAFGLTPATKGLQRNSVAASSTAYKTPDFTISMNADPNAKS